MDIFCEHVKNMLLPLVEKGSRREFLLWIVTAVNGRLLFVSKWEDKLTIGLGPRESQPGDSIVALFGGNSPFILRPQTCPESGARTWKLVGPCYMDGLMRGDIVEDWLSIVRPTEVYDIA